MNKEDLDKLSKKIIGIAINVHKNLGPGFPEKIYQKALAIELNKFGLKTEREAKITINWDKKIIGYQFIDLFIENEFIVEIKIAHEISDLYKAQLFSYLKAANKKLGLILNFGRPVLEIKRIVNNL